MLRETMRAAVIAKPGGIEIITVPKPEPAPGEVRIRMQGSGVCASSTPAFEGRVWFSYPFEAGKPGHEGWGVVDALGSGVTGLAVGDRVAAISYRAFAEYDVATADAVVKLPASLGDAPFPGEAIGCAMNIFRRAQVEPEHTVAVVGAGFLGALVTRLCARTGARVAAVSRRASSLALASRFGADLTLSFGEIWDVSRKAKGWAGADGFDRVIECTGEQRPLDLASELVRTGGRLVIAGYHQDGLRQVNMQLWNWRGIDVVNAHEREVSAYVRGVREAVDAVASRHLDPSPLYTHLYPLEELGEAMRAVRERPEGFVKALVTIS